MAEQLNNGQHDREQSSENRAELETIREAGLERQSEQLEKRSHDKEHSSAETSAESAKHEALERAKSKEAAMPEEREIATVEKRNTQPTKKDKKAAYNATMKDIRTQMPAPSRAFSKFIHNPVIEKTSEVVGSTVARPDAILAGSVSAFIIVLGVYVIAHVFGYPLSGAETIFAFILGWFVGILYDFFRVMITGKTQ